MRPNGYLPNGLLRNNFSHCMFLDCWVQEVVPFNSTQKESGTASPRCLDPGPTCYEVTCNVKIVFSFLLSFLKAF